MAVKDILARKSVNKTEIVEYQSSFDFEEFEITDKKTIFNGSEVRNVK